MSSDAEYDILVVGAGTAGLSCSVSAAELGLKVAVVEQLRQIGGTLHRTGGMMSAAGTRRQRAKGIVDDDVEKHLQDVLRIARSGYDPQLIESAVHAAPELIDWLDSHGFLFDEDAPAIYYGHEPYSIPRTYWGQASGLSILEALQHPWDSAVATGRITPFVGHTLGELDVKGGTVHGVVAASIDTGVTRRIRALNVVLATGGFGSNPQMYLTHARRDGQPPSASMPGSQGVGHLAAMSAGAMMRHSKELLRLGRFPLPNNVTRVDMSIRADFEALGRAPREIWVNQRGERFVDETEPVNTVQEHALVEQPEQTFWAVFDTRALVSGQSLVRGWRPEHYASEAAGDAREVWSAGTIDALARAAGIDEKRLVHTVEGWNDGIVQHAPWRNGAPMTIDTPPYFALRCRGAILTTFSGLVTNSGLQVLTSDGDPLRNLYAVGEVLGVAAVNGEAWVGGMCVTPAMSLGRELAKVLAGASDSMLRQPVPNE